MAPWRGLRWPALPTDVVDALDGLSRAVGAGADETGLQVAAAELVAAVSGSESVSRLCIDLILEDDRHPCILAAERGAELSPSLRALLCHDLRRLQQVTRCPWQQWLDAAGVPSPGPAGDAGSTDHADVDEGDREPWSHHAARAQLVARLEESADWAETVDDLTDYWRHFGAGPRQGIAAYRLHREQGRALLAPITAFDAFPLDWLQFGGARVDLLEQNTRALVEGRGASNALIWGPRGCGKSTLLRGLVGRYWARGLRAIEVPPTAYGHIDALYGLVRERHETFIAVLDNISLEPQDADHRMLASLLDGGLERRPANLVFYATSNYKDLVDRHGERSGAPPRAPAAPDPGTRPGATEPTMVAYDPQGPQRLDERRALDDRFALKIYIDRPTPAEYEQIVLAYAHRAGLPDAADDLLADFRIWCMRHNHDLIGGRTARDYVRHRQTSWPDGGGR